LDRRFNYSCWDKLEEIGENLGNKAKSWEGAVNTLADCLRNTF